MSWLKKFWRNVVDFRYIDFRHYKGWYYLNICEDLIQIDLENPFKTMNKIKEVFIPLRPKLKFGRHRWYFWQGKIFGIYLHDLEWKDKYNTPRCEEEPIIGISIFNFWFTITWKLPLHLGGDYVDNYWEQAVWYLYYNKKNLIKAKERWPWANMETGKSSWKDYFILNSYAIYLY